MAKSKTPTKKTKKTPAKSGNKKFKRLTWLLVLSPIIGLAGLFTIVSFTDLPNVEELANPETKLATQIFTSDGEVLGKYFSQNRTDLAYKNIPQDIINALIATEDERYYSHSGIDFYATVRAILLLGRKGGGSTITQQLAKMQFTKNKSTRIKRILKEKPGEYILASRLEKLYTKEEIIALYFNQYDFLNQAVGLTSAAKIYFNKDAKDLELHECAMLVGMFKNSALYNPLRRDSLVQARRNVVFGQMVRNEMLTKEEFDSLKVLPLGLDYQRISHDEGSAQYFREELRKKVKRIIGEKDDNGNYVRVKKNGEPYDIYNDGLRVYTTIDSRMQEYAEWAVQEHLREELQDAFTKELSWLKEKNYPFYNGIKDKDRDKLMGLAKKESPRWRTLHGKECPNCRGTAHISTVKSNPVDSFKCSAYGCGGHTWPVLDEKGMNEVWNKPTKTKVFTFNGVVDTIMSPLDSVKHHLAILNSGLVSMDPTNGQIKAWVGGVNYKFFKYDHAGQAKRQVGSTFKPFVYANSLRSGMHPCEEIPNVLTCVEAGPNQDPWCPKNSGGKYGNMVSLNSGLANSMNTITAYQIKRYGTEEVVKLAHKMGVVNEIPNVPSIGLGTVELTVKEVASALSTFANQGVYVEPIFLTHIEDKNGNIIYESDQITRQALDPKTAYLTLNMMKKVVTQGTSVRLTYGRPYGRINFPLAGKTGTTNDNGDGWFVGLTPNLATAVWVGASNRAIRFRTTGNGQGANTGLPIFGYYINKVYKDETIDIDRGDFKKPDVDLDSYLDCGEYNDLQGGSGGFGDEDLFGGEEEDEEGMWD
ncbi:MAG: penicillin-binding protein 1A [Flavobacteriales bacterium]